MGRGGIQAWLSAAFVFLYGNLDAALLNGVGIRGPNADYAGTSGRQTFHEFS